MYPYGFVASLKNTPFTLSPSVTQTHFSELHTHKFTRAGQRVNVLCSKMHLRSKFGYCHGSGHIHIHAHTHTHTHTRTHARVCIYFKPSVGISLLALAGSPAARIMHGCKRVHTHWCGPCTRTEYAYRDQEQLNLGLFAVNTRKRRYRRVSVCMPPGNVHLQETFHPILASGL